MRHYNNGKGQAVCGSFEGLFVGWKEDCQCPKCIEIKSNIQRRISKMRRLDMDRIILQNVLADNKTEVSLEDMQAIHERLREIKVERENLFPKNVSEAFFMGQMQEREETVEHE